MHKTWMSQPQIFSRVARRRAILRADSSPTGDRWIITAMVGEILSRLDAVVVPFARAIIIGQYDDALAANLAGRGIEVVVATPTMIDAAHLTIVCDEDRLAFRDHSADLVIALGTFDTVNDLPGALMLARRVLTPGGLFLGAMVGAGSLDSLRAAFKQIEPGVARLHPQIDVRGAGDLLSRAGFEMPVADNYVTTARYSRVARLLSDLRANGLTNVLLQRRALTRATLAQLASTLEGKGLDKFEESIAIITLTGWSAQRPAT